MRTKLPKEQRRFVLTEGDAKLPQLSFVTGMEASTNSSCWGGVVMSTRNLNYPTQRAKMDQSQS